MARHHKVFGRIIDIWRILPNGRGSQFLWLLILMLITAFLEILGIGSLIPFLGLLVSPGEVFNFKYAILMEEFLGLTNQSSMVVVLTIIFCIINIISGVFRFFLMYFQNHLSYSVGAELSVEIYRRVLFQDYLFHISRNSSEIIAGIINKAHSIVTGAIYPLLVVFSSIFIATAIVISLILISPTIALVSFSVLGGVYILLIIFLKEMHLTESGKMNVHYAKRLTILQEGLGGIRETILAGSQDFSINKYQTSEGILRQSLARLQVLSAAPKYFLETFVIVMIAISGCVAVINGKNFQAYIPVIGALAFGVQRLMPVIQNGYSAWSAIQGNSASVGDALDFLAINNFVAKDSKPSTLPSFDRCLELKHISFCYPNSREKTLNQISLKIYKGSRVGIIGKTGCGKSTLLDVLMGMLYPDDGSIILDGVEISQENIGALRQLVGHVPQSIFLSDSTIEENIAFGVGCEYINISRVREVAKLAQLSETIERWDQGYKTIVGERGVRLSGGQIQRIGIARALYKDPKILIFDEATSALDNHTESNLMASINSLPKDLTIVMVAHRLSSLSGCDAIISIDSKGCVSEISGKQK